MKEPDGYRKVDFTPMEKDRPARLVVFNYDIPLLNIVQNERFEVKYDYDRRPYILIRKMKLYLTTERNLCGAYRTYQKTKANTEGQE